MAEWLRRGLQILARRFDSGSGLHFQQSYAVAGVRFVWARRRTRARHQITMPVTESNAGMIPPRNISTCQTIPMSVPSCQRRIVRASVSGDGGAGGVAAASASDTTTSVGGPLSAAN